MAGNANQETIIIEKRVRDKDHPYGMISLKATQEAMQNLSTIGGIKLWLYLNKNKDNYIFDLSKAELEKNWGFTKNTYYAGKEELKKKGYLTLAEGKTQLYVFHEFAQVSENQTKVVEMSENQTELLESLGVSENQTNELDLDENQTNEVELSENQTKIITIGGFVF